MELNWLQLLEAFEVSFDDGGADFAELVLRLINHYRWTGERAKVGQIVEIMRKERGCTSRQLYQKMKAAVKNIIVSDESALKLWEIYPEKRTSSMLAVAIAEREIRQIEARKQKKID